MRLIVVLFVAFFVAPTDAASWFEGPKNSENRETWINNLKSERNSALKSINYKGGVFDNPTTQWTQTSYMQPQMHPYGTSQ
jgi:hypothetical protein